MRISITDKALCSGCEACAQICVHKAIEMREDHEGFRYPEVMAEKCVDCGLCTAVCMYKYSPVKYSGEKYVYGGYHKDDDIRFESTSGGAFSAIVEAYCDNNYVIFGAEADGKEVHHGFISDKNELSKFRKSKYSQSIIGDSYKQTRQFLKEGKKVLFSGTPCHIAGLRNYLRNVEYPNLLTVEVICEGVPSPLFLRKLDQHYIEVYGAGIASIDYRYTGKALFQKGKWDFQQFKIKLHGQKKGFVKDRWINPFWSLWLRHLMSRPSCYNCLFTTSERCADISLGDLWGVHLYCPELYGKNGGSSLIVCNTDKGASVVKIAKDFMYGHELDFDDALRYQSPMRKCIDENPDRERFMNDLQSSMTYKELINKWYKGPSLRLLWQKYIWGNRQKVFFWELKNAKQK